MRAVEVVLPVIVTLLVVVAQAGCFSIQEHTVLTNEEASALKIDIMLFKLALGTLVVVTNVVDAVVVFMFAPPGFRLI